MPKWSPRLKRQLPLPEPQGSTSIDGTTPKAMQGGPLVPRSKGTPPGSHHLNLVMWRPSSGTSSIVREARFTFFSKHSHNFVEDGTCDLLDIFKELAERAGLLGNCIYEIQLSWTGPEKLKQANYTLWSLPKGLRFLRVVPTSESPKVMGLMGIHVLDALQMLCRLHLLVPGVVRRGRIRGWWLTIWGQPTTG